MNTNQNYFSSGLLKKSNFFFSEKEKHKNNNFNNNNDIAAASSEIKTEKNNNLLEDEKEIKDEPENYSVNIKKKENFRILQDYFYEGNIDKSNVLPSKRNQDEVNLLNIPEYRELYKNFSLVIREDQYHEIDNIKHDVVENDKKFKYGLMVRNEMPFKEMVLYNQEEAVEKTATESLFELLEMDNESSYESMVLKFRTHFQHGKNISTFNSRLLII